MTHKFYHLIELFIYSKISPTIRHFWAFFTGMAGRFATKLKAKKLILTHYSQRYRPIDSELKEGESSIAKLLEQAKESFQGEVIAADDFTIVSCPLPK